MRLRVSADSRITVLSRFNGGRPMRGGLYDILLFIQERSIFKDILRNSQIAA
jgi:hypothetical protein